MKEFPFVWTELKPLSAELGIPIDSISVEFLQRWPQCVTLWRSDGTGIRIHSEMVDLAERIEVGVLHFDCVVSPSADEVFAELAPAFGTGFTVSKLVIAESGASVESGIVLTARSGDEIVVVANAFPCNLAIRGVPSITEIFEPEHPLDTYTRVAMS